MSRLRCHISISLDGFVAGPNQSEENPLGEGGEQNAPLGRAVIGGLLMATIATLFFVPAMYTLLRRKPPLDLTTPELQQRKRDE